jgi:indolepyruvate ferredoxin oxidoreductase
MAYKDEYEVARLSLKDDFQTKLRTEFGEQARIHYRLHPPFLRAMGLKKKLALGQWFNPVYRLLYAMRFVRHTAFDIFGYAKVRRVERQLIADYQRLIQQELDGLSPASYERAVQLAKLPDMIRGYEEIKLANVEAFWDAVKGLRVTKDALAA